MDNADYRYFIHPLRNMGISESRRILFCFSRLFLHYVHPFRYRGNRKCVLQPKGQELGMGTGYRDFRSYYLIKNTYQYMPIYL